MMKKELGVIELTMASVTGMVGSGWLFSAFYASSIAGPYSVISWLIGALIIISLALVYAELGSRMPMAGAAAAYPYYTNGNVAGTINSWSLFLGYASTPPLETIASITYMSFLVPGLITSSGFLTFKGIVLSVVLLFLFFFINSIGIKTTSKVNNYVSYLKIIIPLMTSFFFIFTIFSIKNFTYTGGIAYRSIFTAVPAAGIAFSFLGFRQAVELSGEAKNPQKTVPKAIFLSVGIATALYVIVQIAFIGSFQWNGLNPGNWASIASSSYKNGPMLVLASVLGLGSLVAILLFDGIISPLGTSNIYQTSTARVSYQMSSMGYFPKKFSQLSSKNVPFYSLLFDFIIMILFVLPFPSWQSLVSINSGLSIIAYMSGPVSLLIFRKQEISSSGFKLPFAGIIAPMAFAFSALIIYWSGFPDTFYMSIIAFAGLILFAFKNKGTEMELKSGMWIILILVVIPLVSYLGSYNLNVLKYPFDLLLVFIA
ncbi:MAG: APC family permease, partial [Thermoplasmata archaeon]